MSNDYWMDVLKQNVEFGENYDAEYEKAVNEITSDDIVKLVKAVVGSGNYIQMTMSPEK